jgi:hypothetical protein
MARVTKLPKGAAGTAGVIDFAEPTTLGERYRPSTGSRVAALAPDVGWARLTADDDPRRTLVCALGDGFPQIEEGYAIWEDVDRSKDISLTDWRGYKPMLVALPLLLDDYANAASIENAVDMLEALAGRGKLRAGRGMRVYEEPPKLIVDTHGLMPYDAQSFPDMRWVIADLDWDEEETITNDHGNRVRAPVTVALKQHVDAERLHDRGFEARKRQQAHSGAKRRYTAKQGDTLISIARHQLGDPGRWMELAKLNGIRDPRAVRKGAVIRLP